MTNEIPDRDQIADLERALSEKLAMARWPNLTLREKLAVVIEANNLRDRIKAAQHPPMSLGARTHD